MNVIPLSLYIHVPWCIKKCPYCDFNSHETKIEIDEDRYIDALITDLESELPHIWGRPIQTIFIGGGTPSLLSADAYDKLLSAIRARVTLKNDAEITLEANPATFEQKRFSAYRKAGINRLSIGAQSFHQKQLSSLGRVHNDNDAINAAKMARKAGFDNFNIDIMFGLPEQSIEEGLADLQQAIDLSPTHISWYQLTIEENTLFYHQPPKLPNDDNIWELQLAGQKLLSEHGYHQYEVSAYAKDKQYCEHNINYWEFGDYVGIGAGAHGKVSMPDKTITRHIKYRHPKDYIKNALAGKPRADTTDSSAKDSAFEFMLNALRLNKGFDKDLFFDRTHQTLESIYSDILKQAFEDGLLIEENNIIQTTELGKQHLNSLIERFL